MTAFVLIHGGAHGAWCWDRLIPELERRSNRAIAVDLPCSDRNAGAEVYARTVAAAVPDDDTVLVAHSLGGLTAPLTASRCAVRQVVFIAALLPVPGESLRDQQVREPEMMLPYSGGPAGLRARFYHACDPADADWAMSRIRPQAITPFVEVTPLLRWPEVECHYLVCSDDRAVSPEWGRHVARTRLQVDPVELPGSDHSPFLSRPAQLAAVLDAIAADTPLADRVARE